MDRSRIDAFRKRAAAMTGKREMVAAKLREAKIHQLNEQNKEITDEEIEKLQEIEDQMRAEQYERMEEDEIDQIEVEAAIYETTKDMTQEELNEFMDDDFNDLDEIIREKIKRERGDL